MHLYILNQTTIQFDLLLRMGVKLGLLRWNKNRLRITRQANIRIT